MLLSAVHLSNQHFSAAGNENNFETMEECMVNCRGPGTRDLHPTTSFYPAATPSVTPRSVLAAASSSAPGESAATTAAPFEQSTRRSLKFCKSHLSSLHLLAPGRFCFWSRVDFLGIYKTPKQIFRNTEEESVLAVKNISLDHHPYPWSTYLSLDVSAVTSSPVSSLCSLPQVAGPCSAFATRYYFDPSKQQCRQFR